MKIRIIINAVMLFALLCANSYGQSKTDSNAVNGDILKKKPVALQFAIGENFTLENFSRYNLLVKKQLSQNMALRLGVGVNYSNLDLDGTYYQITTNQTIKSTNNVYSAEIVFIYYINPKDNVKGYFGIGPAYRFMRLDREYITFNNQDTINTSTLSKDNSIGGNLIFGAEWFFTENFSLFTEYNFAITYSKITEQSVNYNQGYEVTEFTGDAFSIYGDALKFGLSVYF